MTALRSIAHIRTGDKGDTCQFSVIAYDAADYPFLLRHLTVPRVTEHLCALPSDVVHRFELPQLHALIFVMERALHSGVTRSLALDAHGKCIGATLLSMELPADPADPAVPAARTRP